MRTGHEMNMEYVGRAVLSKVLFGEIVHTLRTASLAMSIVYLGAPLRCRRSRPRPPSTSMNTHKSFVLTLPMCLMYASRVQSLLVVC